MLLVGDNEGESDGTLVVGVDEGWLIVGKLVGGKLWPNGG